MASLGEIIDFLDRELRTAEVRDYPGAMNGLQLGNSGKVGKVFSAVDASLAVISEAAREKSSLLIVHHGMFWQGIQPITGPYYRKLKMAMDADLAIYSTHLPLDVHPLFGNNVLLAQAIGLKAVRPILEKNGFAMGVAGSWFQSLEELKIVVGNAVGRTLVTCEAGNAEPKEIAVITGGAGSQVREVAEAGFDTFITGEGPHWSYIEAQERGLNVIYAGHYATETFGIKELGARIATKFGINSSFVELSGGL
jgi:dinuclear metal center YbgI/SA1388 family protein